MFKRVSLGVLVLILAGATVNAQVGAMPGQVETVWNAQDLTAALGTSTAYSLLIGNNGAPVTTWQTTYSVAPASITITLEGSTDCSSYATIDTSTNVNGEIRTVFGSYRCVRLNNSAVGTGAGKTLTAKLLYTTGRGIGSVSGSTIYTGGTFTGPLLLPDGTAGAKALGFASAPTLGVYKSVQGFGIGAPGTAAGIHIGANGVYVGISGSFWNAWMATNSTGSSFQLASNSALAFTDTAGGADSAGDTFLRRDAANTLALRNSTNAQTFNIYNTWTDASNYERGYVKFESNSLKIGFEALGTGTTTRGVELLSGSGFLFKTGGGSRINIDATGIYPQTADTYDSGYSTIPWKNTFVNRSIQGSKQKTALADASATGFVKIALPQTVGSNFTSGTLLYHLHCDNGTAGTYADRAGSVSFSCNNISGTEACAFDANVQTTTQAATYALAAPTWTATGGTDEVTINVNDDCTGVVGPTNFTINYRLDMLVPQTLTPL